MKVGEGSLKEKSSCDLLFLKLNGLKDQLVNPLVIGGEDIQRIPLVMTTDIIHKNINNTKSSDISSSGGSKVSHLFLMIIDIFLY
jgi:hypothetical protein